MENPTLPALPLDAVLEDFEALDVLGDAGRVWLLQLPAFAGIVLVLHAPLLLLTLLPALPVVVSFAILVVAELFISLLVKAALAKAAVDARRSLSTSFRELFEAVGRMPAALAAGVPILARAAIRLPLIVPCVKLLVRAYVAVPAAVLEGSSPWKALRRSEDLTHGARLPILGFCLLTWTLAAGLILLSGLHKVGTFGNATWLVVYILSRTLDQSFAAVLAAMTYDRLTER